LDGWEGSGRRMLNCDRADRDVECFCVSDWDC
jgi:hypothetical protein